MGLGRPSVILGSDAGLAGLDSVKDKAGRKYDIVYDHAKDSSRIEQVIFGR